MTRLVALDLDGTLLNSKQEIDPYTIETLRFYESRGYQFVFCSGRNLTELANVCKLLPFFRYALLCNGAYIYDFREKRFLYEATLPIREAYAIYRKLDHLEMIFELNYHDRILTSRQQLGRLSAFGISHLENLITNTRECVDDLVSHLASSREPVGKVNIFFPCQELRDKAREIIEPLPYTTCYQEPKNFEINRLEVHKGSSLAILAQLLGLSSGEVMAMGDNVNDLPMFSYAGTAVAMENAIPAAKEAADFVTHSNDDNGVAYALETLLPQHAL